MQSWLSHLFLGQLSYWGAELQSRGTNGVWEVSSCKKYMIFSIGHWSSYSKLRGWIALLLFPSLALREVNQVFHRNFRCSFILEYLFSSMIWYYIIIILMQNITILNSLLLWEFFADRRHDEKQTSLLFIHQNLKSSDVNRLYFCDRQCM